MASVLVFSPDAVPLPGVLAAGPGIRYFEISKSLAAEGHEVCLAVPAEVHTDGDIEGLSLAPWVADQLDVLLRDADVVVLPHVHGALSLNYAKQAPPRLPTVVDLYDPVLIENLGLQEESGAGLACFLGYLGDVLPLLRRGDLFLYANERQRYYYLGVLNAIGRINPLTYRSGLLKKVPFGVSGERPPKKGGVMRGSLFDKTDKIILWFSGIYPWFDAATLVRAMPIILKSVPNAKLAIMGGVHPRSHAPDSEFVLTRELAQKSGLIGESIHFLDWRPYAERGKWYADADIAVATHKETLEMELSHRTRVVDFLWAGLPVIVSDGDEVGSMVRDKECGMSVPIGDPGALAAAIIKVLTDDELLAGMASNAARLARTELSWKLLTGELSEFCRKPRLAPDRALPGAIELLAGALPLPKMAVAGGEAVPGLQTSLLGKVRNVYVTEGTRAVFKKAAGFAGRKIRDTGK